MSVQQQHGRTVKSIRGKLYFYRGTVLLMVIERNPQSEQAAKDYLARACHHLIQETAAAK